MLYFIQGLTMGLAYVAPIGMQNMFVINSGLTQKTARVYQTALIVIFFDITLAVACFFGIGALMAQARILEMGILLVGSIVVIIMGIKLILAKDTMESDQTDMGIPILKVISMACVVTWFNPQALIDGSLMLGAFKATLPAGEAGKFIVGVALASFGWFMGLSTITHLFRSKFNDKMLKLINVLCGAVILFYGAKLGYSFIQML